MKEPEIVSATQAEIDELLVLAKSSFPPKQYKLLQGVLATFLYMLLKLQNAKSSIKRLRGMLFGNKTEHMSNLLGAPTDGGVEAGLIEAGLITPVAALATEIPKKPRAPGHGRNAAADYSGAATVECSHATLKSGERCPTCQKGRVYESPPQSLVKVVGQAPLGATVYKLQRLRCRLCDAIFTAPLNRVTNNSKNGVTESAISAKSKFSQNIRPIIPTIVIKSTRMPSVEPEANA